MASAELTSHATATCAPQDALVVLDADGVIRQASRQVFDLFGRYPDEFIGQPIEWLVPARLRTQRLSQWHELAADALPGETGAAFEILGLQRDGTEFPIQVSVIAAGDAPRKLFVAVIRDLTLSMTDGAFGSSAG